LCRRHQLGSVVGPWQEAGLLAGQVGGWGMA
jgi:hypothetical protein